jgi:hypothetical protein
MSSRRALVVLFALAFACSKNAGDGTIVVDTVARCQDPQPAQALPEFPFEGRRKEFFSKHPLAQVTSRRGPTIPAPRVVAVFFGDDPTQHVMEAFLQSYGCTSYWRDIASEYGIGDLTYSRSLVLPPPPDFTGKLDEWIAAGLRDGAFGTLADYEMLLLFLPVGARGRPSDCSALIGAHDALGTLDGHVLPYAYVADCYPTHASAERIAIRTFVAAHEMIEMATNPVQIGWTGLDDGLLAPSMAAPHGTGEVELADLCAGTTGGPDYPFAVTRAYSNRAARAGLDPCNPGAPSRPVAALQGVKEVDLSVTELTLTVDVFADDPSREYFLIPTILVSHELQPATKVPLDAPLTIVHDGMSVPLAIRTTVPASSAPDIASASYLELALVLCEQGSASDCSATLYHVTKGPPVEQISDAGAPD